MPIRPSDIGYEKPNIKISIMPKRISIEEYNAIVKENEELIKKVDELENKDLDEILYWFECNRTDYRLVKVPTLASLMEFEEWEEEFKKKYNF